jgi:hypothetical protein
MLSTVAFCHAVVPETFNAFLRCVSPIHTNCPIAGIYACFASEGPWIQSVVSVTLVLLFVFPSFDKSIQVNSRKSKDNDLGSLAPAHNLR